MTQEELLDIDTDDLISQNKYATAKRKSQNLKTLELKDHEKRKVDLKDLSFPVNLLKKVFKNEDGSTGE